MATRIEVTIDCEDPDRLVDFWCAALGYERFGSAHQYRSIVPPPGSPVPGPKVIFQQVPEPKVGKARIHLDLIVGADNLDAEVARIEALGATRHDRVEELGGRWQVMTDPEGNEFCVCAE